jgi:CRISPR-associated endonuclease Csn1
MIPAVNPATQGVAMQRIWGFDLGTASVGFAVVEFDEATAAGRIVRLGSRVFPEGVDEEKREPRNWQRRAARLMRRQVRRRRWRRFKLRRALVEAGLLPRSELCPDPRRPTELMAGTCPYELRAKGLRERLEPYELGRVIFHLAKRRGFSGSRKFGDNAADAQRARDEGRVNASIDKLRKKMAGSHLSEFLASLPPGERKRGRYLGRKMVQDEFEALWSRQAACHRELLSSDLKERLKNLIFFQRPTFWRLNTIGKCELEPGEDRCPKGDWHGQRFVMLQMLNDLRLSGDRPLSQAQRAQALAMLEAKRELRFEALRKKLGLKDDKLNFELGGEKKALGNATEEALVRVFGRQWQDLPARGRIRDEIAKRLWDVEYRRIGNRRVEIHDAADVARRREEFADAATRDYGIRPEQAKALSEIDLPPGWLSHSKRAILKMLPEMEAGRPYEEAKAIHYPPTGAASGARQSRLGEPPKEVRNPTVARTLHELQKVVNNLLSVHGAPDLIRIELARDLKLPREKRRELEAEQRRNRKAREDARQKLQEQSARSASAEEVEKYLLAQECGWRCPYSGQQISFAGLFQDGLFEIDHIVPYSRSFDNSFINKTVCHRDANREKGNRTPFEAFGNSERWAQILERLEKMKSNGLSLGKIARIRRETAPGEAGSEDFANRQLSDTAHIARAARDYLADLGYPVEVTNGRATAILRRLWGLETVLSDAPGGKNRDDHRHHAVDALVVALTTRAFIKRASGYYGAGRAPERAAFPTPWLTLHQDAARTISAVVVSHRAQRKISGPLHEETRLGDTGIDAVGQRGVTLRKYVTRKPLSTLSKEEIKEDAIVDPVVRKIVRDHVQARGGNPKTAFRDSILTLPNRNGSPVPIRRVRIRVEQQAHLIKSLRPDASAFAKAGSNHHVVIFKNAAGRPDFRVVSMFDAAMRLSERKPIIDRNPEAGAKFLGSLCIGDMLKLVAEDGCPRFWVVKSLWASGQVAIQPHNAAGDAERCQPLFASLIQAGEEHLPKVVVDPIGRVFEAND